MRRTVTWLAGLAGIAALLRRRSRTEPAAPAATQSPPDPAAELRRKLEETRDAPSRPRMLESEPAASLDERRARVHDKAHDVISSMRVADLAPADEGREPDS